MIESSHLKFICLLVAAALLLGITYGRAANTWNVATYIYLAKTVLEGGIPYRDAYDVKSPGIFYYYVFATALVGKGAMGMRAVDALWQALTALVVGWVAGKVYGTEFSQWAAAAGYLVMQIYYSTWAGFADADTVVSFPVALGILCTLLAREGDRWHLWFGAGLAVGVAVLFKLPAGLVGVAVLVAALLHRPRHAARLTTRLAGLAAGFALPLAACGIYFWANGALEDLLVAQFVIAPNYVRLFNVWHSWPCIRQGFTQPYVLPLYPLGLLAALGLAQGSWRELGRGHALVIGWTAAALFALLLHGLLFPYHFMPLAAPLAILGGGALAHAWQDPRTNGAARWALVGIVLAYVALPVWSVPGAMASSWRQWRGQSGPKPTWAVLAESLRARTASGDTLFVWGNLPRLYLDADRRSASRFFHALWLSVPSLGIPAKEIFLADMKKAPPRFIVVSKAGPIGGVCPFVQVDYYGAFRSFDGLQRLLAEQYVQEEETNRYILYRRAEGPDPRLAAPQCFQDHADGVLIAPNTIVNRRPRRN